MSKTKVAVISPIYNPANLSGSEYINELIAKLLAGNNIDVTIISSDSSGVRYIKDLFSSKRLTDSKLDGITIKRFQHNEKKAFLYFILSKIFFLFPFLSFLRKYSAQYYGPQINIRAVHSYLQQKEYRYIYASPLPNYMIVDVIELCTKNNNKPTVIVRPDFHEKLPEYKSIILKKVFIHADIIHVLSKSEQHAIQSTFKISPNKFKIIPNTIYQENYSEVEMLIEKVNTFKNKYSLQNKKLILFAGTKNYFKGAFFTAQAIKKLHNKNSSYFGIFIGNDSLSWKLQKILYKDVILDLGYVAADLKEILFAACDLFCMPSISEAFGLVYLEAWHKKKPVIGSNIPAIKELILNNKGGICVEFDNIPQLSLAIEHIMTDTNLSYGKNGKEALVKNYNYEIIQKQYLKLFTT